MLTVETLILYWVLFGVVWVFVMATILRTAVHMVCDTDLEYTQAVITCVIVYVTQGAIGYLAENVIFSVICGFSTWIGLLVFRYGITLLQATLIVLAMLLIMAILGVLLVPPFMAYYKQFT